MSNLANTSKGEIQSKLSRALSTLKNSREAAKAVTARTVNTALTAGAGYGVGALRAHFGEGADKKVLIPGTQVEADLALGIVASLAGVMGVADEYSPHLCAIGGGALAGYAAISAFNRSAE